MAGRKQVPFEQAFRDADLRELEDVGGIGAGQLGPFQGRLDSAASFFRRRMPQEKLRALKPSADVRASLGLPRPPAEKDWGVDGFIADLLDVYAKAKKLKVGIGRPVPTSVGGPGSKAEGQATGPLVRFVQAACKIVGVPCGDSDAVRRRIRRLPKVRKASKSNWPF